MWVCERMGVCVCVQQSDHSDMIGDKWNQLADQENDSINLNASNSCRLVVIQ